VDCRDGEDRENETRASEKGRRTRRRNRQEKREKDWRTVLCVGSEREGGDRGACRERMTKKGLRGMLQREFFKETGGKKLKA